MKKSVSILWTKQLTKKQKTWNDGFVLLKPSGAAILYDEAGKELSTSRLPKSISNIAEHDEPLRCWDGYLVQYDSDCRVCDIPGVAAGPVCTGTDHDFDSHTRNVSVQQWQQTAPLPATQQHQQQHQQQARAPLVPQVVRRRPSCTVSAATAQNHTAAVPQHQHQPKKWQQTHLQQPQQLQVAARHAAPCSAVGSKPNSDRDILQLLDSINPAASASGVDGACNFNSWGQQQNQPQQQSPCSSDYQWAPGAVPHLARNQPHRLPQQLRQWSIENQAEQQPHYQQQQQWQQQGAHAKQWQQQQQQQQHGTQQQQPLPAQQERQEHITTQENKSSKSGRLQEITNRWGTHATRSLHAAAPEWQQQQLADLDLALDLDCTVRQLQMQQQQLQHVQQRHSQTCASESSSMNLARSRTAANRWAVPRTQATAGHPQQQQQQVTGQQKGSTPQWQQQPGPFPVQGGGWGQDLGQDAQQRQQQQEYAAPQVAESKGDNPKFPSTAAANADIHSSIDAAVTRQEWQHAANNCNAQQPLQPLLTNTSNQWQQQHMQGKLHDSSIPSAAAAAAASAVAGEGAAHQLRAGCKRPGGFVTPRVAVPTRRTQQQQQQRDSQLLPIGADKPAAGMQQQQLLFRFPRAGSTMPLRCAAIPTSFRTAAEYKLALLAALAEEVNLKLADQARTFHSIAEQVMAQQQLQLKQQPQWLQAPFSTSDQQDKLVLRTLNQQQKHQPGSLAQLQGFCSRSGMQYHPNSSLTVYQRSSNSSKFGGYASKGKHKGGKGKHAKGAKADDGDSEGDPKDDQPAVKMMSMFLTLAGKIDRRKFRKHQLWILSDQPLLNAAAYGSAGTYSRTCQGWVIIGRSLWHAPDRDGRMEVEILPGQMPAGHRWLREQSVAALQAPDVTTEVQVADFISSMEIAAWPLLGSLIRQQQQQQQKEHMHQQAVEPTGGDAASMLLPAAGKSSSNEGDVAGSSGSDNDYDIPVDACVQQHQRVQQQQARKKPRLSNGSTGVADSAFDSDGEEQEMSYENHDAAAVLDVPSTSTAAATADVASLQAKAQVLLHNVTQRFTLNAAQAQVATHVADWLPQLMAPTPHQQLQHARLPAGLQRRKVKAAATAAGVAAADAESVVANARSSSSSSSSGRPPVCLIHGPFGSGKSTLLVALIHLITGLVPGLCDPATGAATGAKKRNATAAGALRCPRILVAAHTNVAVDRVLLTLLDSGFSNMLRVGSLQRIARRLLAHSLHSGDDSKDALSQLQAMLQDAAGAEAEMIRSEIAQVQAGAERQRRKRLSTAAVVGVTCCAALQATLEGQQFDIVLLDESSQMTEPTSLVPLLRAKPRFLIAAGDPCQLPPVLASPTGVTAAAAGAAASTVRRSSVRGSDQQQQQQGLLYGLLRPLFVRLTHLGHEEHLLTHQYRCHPTLSMLSNKHFYNSLLINGVTEQQRAPIIPGLPPLVFLHCLGGRSQSAEGAGRSSVNQTEARLVVHLVQALLNCRVTSPEQQHRRRRRQQQLGQVEDAMDDADNDSAEAATAAGSCGSDGQADDDDNEDAPAVAPHQLGVICFFRGQATLIKQMLTAESACCGASDVHVATVDSFQGAEKEIIVLATTTTNPRSEFCSDGARLNVALTRAKRHLVVVGAAEVLSEAPSAVLQDLVRTCKSGTAGASYMTGSGILALPALAAGRS